MSRNNRTKIPSHTLAGNSEASSSLVFDKPIVWSRSYIGQIMVGTCNCEEQNFVEKNCVEHNYVGQNCEKQNCVGHKYEKQMTNSVEQQIILVKL